MKFNNTKKWIKHWVKKEDYTCVSAGGVYPHLKQKEIRLVKRIRVPVWKRMLIRLFKNKFKP